MTTQSEQRLEDQLIADLQQLEYDYVRIQNEADLLANLKRQLEKHNGIQLSTTEFDQVLNHLHTGNIFDRATTLRQRMELHRDDDEVFYLEFLQLDQWCQNQFQVCRQVELTGTYKNRYDVTILINGLPLVQIELKRRGLELKEAFNQINRYQRHSFWSAYGLFQYVQLFVISNGVNTKYFANNRDQSFKQTFYWADENNNKITQLTDFTAAFLERCHLSKMICKYIVLHQSHRILMVLRPYQYYATEKITKRVKHGTNNGYVWHTTGSGKTLTSFKASQILMKLPQVHKVVFVVDRKDLDYQTTREFNYFSKGSVDSTSNTKTLIDQFTNDTKLIVTTIQKLNNAISGKRYKSTMEAAMANVIDKKVVFIFDECHRSQFGYTHHRIKEFFKNPQMFGFTGTPIFAKNASKNELGKRTTADLFEECLHKYVITDAIRDENVLKFSAEYVGKYKKKDSANEIDIKVEAIDTKELLEDEKRLSKIVDYIIAHHDCKTHDRKYSAIFCVSSVEVLIKYYQLFKAKKDGGEHDLRIATIFSYIANEADKDADGKHSDEGAEDDGTIVEGNFEIKENTKINQHSREHLDDFIKDYNAMYGTDYSTKDNKLFYSYYKNIAKRLKEREKKTAKDKDRLDILLVVNMFLTGFDAKMVNTLYVDKNLKYHGLIQAYSRTNRIINEQKSQGNIVIFRNLKKATDNALALFSNKEAEETIFVKPYEAYVKEFNAALEQLQTIAPTVKSVDDLPSENEELAYVQAFRELMRLKNVLTSFADFSHDDLELDTQGFEDYKSKYLDIHDKVKSNRQKEKVSILNDVNFELELIHRDEINVAYILQLLGQLQQTDNKADQERQRKTIIDLLNSTTQLRSKRELIEKFIDENLPKIKDADSVPEAFEVFMSQEQQAAFQRLCEQEQLNPQGLQKVIEEYLFTGREPLRDAIVKSLTFQPKIRERKTTGERIKAKIMDFVELFMEHG